MLVTLPVPWRNTMVGTSIPTSRDSHEKCRRYSGDWGRLTVERHIKGATELQRFFSTFPGNWPGLGLLLLRTIAGGAAASQAGLDLADATEPTAGSWALGLFALIRACADRWLFHSRSSRGREPRRRCSSP